MKVSIEPKSLIAEFFGTFMLVLFGCGASVVDYGYGNIIGHLGCSMVWGVVVMAMVYSVGNVSGAHLNPAVTIGFIFARKMDLRIASLYIITQFAGSFVASFLLRLAFPESLTLGETIPSVTNLLAFIIEMVLTFILMFVVLNVSTGHMEKGIMAGVAVGGTVFISALVGGPLTGASMNPARSLGPAVFSGKMSEIFIYLIAPVLGAVIASPLCKVIQGDECCNVES
ncbi:MAG: aquaporin [Spirochaetales bacterium]|nr:aquaporin [Spirochaetales bacterium]